MSPEEKLGREVADLLGEGPSSSRIAAQRIALARRVREPRRGWVAPWFWQVAAVGLMVFVAGAGVMRWGGVGTSESPAAGLVVMADGLGQLDAGSWVRTGATESRTLGFSEGSAVVVSSDSRVRVAEVSATAARISLESGAVHSKIVPRTGVRWVFEAGPHEVVVVGTEFELAWDGVSETLSLEVQKGLVEVRSTGKPGFIPVAAGERLSMDAAGHRLKSNRPAADEVPAPEVNPVLTPMPGAVSSAVGMAPMPGAVPRGVERPSSVPAWKELLRAHEYAAALEAAERSGFDALVASVSAGDLLDLGDAARLSGNVGRARQALLGVTRRFSGSGSATSAALSLGKLAVDLQHDDREAVRWFRTYLASGASGEVAAGVRARLMDSLLRLGDRAGARAVARDYLRYHPTGRHARVAQSLLEPASE